MVNKKAYPVLSSIPVFQKTVVEPALPKECLLQVFNLAERDVAIKIPDSNLFTQSIKPINLEVNGEGNLVLYTMRAWPKEHVCPTT